MDMDQLLIDQYRSAAAQPLESPPPLGYDPVSEMEKILNYRFNDKELLVDALTHPSSIPTPRRNYQRLEFVGDAVLQLAISNYLFLQIPPLDPGHLTLLRAANVSTEKLARTAIRHGFYKFVRRTSAALDDRVREFEYAVRQEEDNNPLVYGGSMKAPKVLADIVESIAAAVYADVGFNLETFWKIFRGILEPIVTLEHLERQPQPITRLFQLCQKQGKHVDIKHWRNGTKNVASVFVDGSFVVSDSSDHKDIAKLDACRKAIEIVAESGLAGSSSYDGSSLTIQEAKQKLNEICAKRKWPKPCYSIETEEGRPHEKIYVSAVQIMTPDGKLYIPGDAKSKVKDSKTSAASFMIHALMHNKMI